MHGKDAVFGVSGIVAISRYELARVTGTPKERWPPLDQYGGRAEGDVRRSTMKAQCTSPSVNPEWDLLQKG